MFDNITSTSTLMSAPTPLPKKQKIVKHIGNHYSLCRKKYSHWLGQFQQNREWRLHFLDKTSLIAESIECDSKVSLIVRPRQFGKTINLMMLRDFFSIPIHSDNENYHHELFKDTKIMKRSDLFNGYFCKYPVIFLSLKGFDGCKTWSEMQVMLCKKLAGLYKEHEYVYDKLDNYEKLNFNKIHSGILQYEITKDALVDLSKYLKYYYKKKCCLN